MSRIGFELGSAFRGFQAGMAGKWEGGETNRLRSRPGRALESVDWGVNYGVREGLLSEARNLGQNFAIPRSITRKYARYCIGSCVMKWNTGDTKIDKIYRDAWKVWMGMPDVQGRHCFPKMTKIAVQRVIEDGRVFGQMDRRGGFFQVLGIEGDRVSSDGIFNADKPGLVSGIRLDGNGRAIAVKVWERSLYGTFQNPKEIPMNQMVHVFDTSRFDSVSGVTAFNAVLDPIRDLKETREAERLAAKRMSKWALLIKKFTGSASVNLFQNDGTSPRDDDAINVQKVGDAADAYFLPGEDAKALENNRPSEGWRWLTEDNIREIAIGMDLPFGVVWHMLGLGGPAVRFEINQANRTFMTFLSDVMDPMWFRPIVAGWMTTELDAKRLPFHPQWYKFQTPRPKAITIDLGKDSKAGIAENAAGLSTASSWYTDEDEDFEESTWQLAWEESIREEAANFYKIPVERIRALGNVTTTLKEADEPSDESEPAPEPAKPLQKGQPKKTRHLVPS